MSRLITIEKNQAEMMAILRGLEGDQRQTEIFDDFLILKPIETEEEMVEFNSKLVDNPDLAKGMTRFLSTFGEKHLSAKTRSVLRFIAQNKEWSFYSLKGKGTKKKQALEQLPVWRPISGNTTNLQLHLDKHHKKNETPTGPTPTPSTPTAASSGTSGPTPPKLRKTMQPKIQPKIGACLTWVGKMSNEKKKQLDDHLQKLIVGKSLPLSLSENTFFRNFVNELDPRYEIPSKYLVKRQLETKRVKMVENVQKDLPSQQGSIALTHDSWTSCATECYDTVTAHFVNEDWEMRSSVLQTSKLPGSHTSERIAERLRETVSKWGLPQQPIMVTDNAANERKAIEQLLGWPRFGCYGHRLNLAVKHALEIHEVSKILGKARKTVTLFHQSTSLSDALVEKQRLLYTATPNQIGLKLVADVPTRWNSTLAMLERLSNQSAAIFAVASDDQLSVNKDTQQKLRTFCFSFEEVLKPFEVATTILCAENVPTMHKTLVSTVKINKILEASPQSSSSLKKVVEKLQEQLDKRTQLEDIPVLATMLNPDTKSLSFLSQNDQTKCHQLLLNTALRLVDENGNFVKVKVEKETPSATSAGGGNDVPDLPTAPDLDIIMPLPNVESVEQTADKSIKCSDMEGWFDDVVITGTSSRPPIDVVQEEVQRYLNSGRDADDQQLSILQWWKKNQGTYPRLSILARKYLAIPASSVPSEKVFSLAGAIVSKKRARLNPDMVDSIIFLKMNMENYW